MAVRTWEGTSNDWADTGNWSGGAIPVDGDDVIFPSTNSQSVTANVDRSSGDLNLHSIYVAPGYGGEIGTSASPLRCGVGSNSSTSSIRHYGAKAFYWANEQDTASDTCPLIIVNSRNKDMAMSIAGDQAITRILIVRGAYTISCTGAITTFIHGWLTDPANDTVGTFESGADVPALSFFSGGRVTSNITVPAGTLIVDGCKYTQNANGNDSVFVGARSHLNVVGGGSSMTIHNGGSTTFENCDVQSAATIWRHANSKLRYDSQMVTVTDVDIWGV